MKAILVSELFINSVSAALRKITLFKRSFLNRVSLFFGWRFNLLAMKKENSTMDLETIDIQKAVRAEYNEGNFVQYTHNVLCSKRVDALFKSEPLYWELISFMFAAERQSAKIKLDQTGENVLLTMVELNDDKLLRTRNCFSAVQLKNIEVWAVNFNSIRGEVKYLLFPEKDLGMNLNNDN